MMKNIFFLTALLSGILFTCLCHGQQWYLSSVPFSKNVNTAFIFNRNSVILAGGDTTSPTHDIFKSKDLGASWVIQIDQANSWIKSIIFNDTLHGYTVGDNGLVLKTTNGGNGWAYTNSPGNFRLNKVWCASDSTIFVFGGNTNIERVIFKSGDAGHTWALLDSAAGACLRSAFFINAQKGFAVGDSATILMTTDSGNTWLPVVAPVSRNFSSITFINPDTGFIVGGSATDSIRSILRTTNAGLSWAVVKDEPGNCFTDISFADGQNGFAVGDRASIFKSTNGGQTWISSSVNGSTSNDYFTCVKYFDSAFAVIGSQAGRSFVYTNTPTPVVDTVWTYYVDSVTYAVNALINTYGTPAICHCDFSTNSNFSPTSTSYNQYITSDTFTHALIFLQALTPHTNYYCRFVVQSILGNQYVDTLSLYTYTPHYFVETDTANSVTLSSAVLVGKLSNFFSPTYPLFNYSTSPNLASASPVQTSPVVVTDTLLHTVYASITGLLPNVTYYYTLTVPSPYGNIAGDTLSFTTYQPTYTFQTLNVSNIGDFSATLNGEVDNLPFPTNLFFDYGLSQSLGDTVTANPGFVNDTSSHVVSANLTSLVPGTTYYYWLRGRANNSEVYYGSLHSFFTNPNYVNSNNLQTLAATNITTSTVQLNGLVDQFPSVLGLHFEYGTTTSFGAQVTGNPATVSDTFEHFIVATPNSLLPDTTYYFRFIGSSGGNIIIGNTYTFNTGTSSPVVQTLRATNRYGNTTTLNGFMNHVVGNAVVSFDYDTSHALNNHTNPNYPASDTGTQYFSTDINIFWPEKLYFFRTKVVTTSGTYYGAEVPFYPDSILPGFQTLTSTVISSSTAQFNGEAEGADIPLRLSFEYGTSPSLGSSVTAAPDTLTDSMHHYISAVVNNLQPNTTYYYRLVGTNNVATFTANIRQLYTGTSEIPNWDFQLWQADTVPVLQGWNIFGNNFMQGPPHSGEHAVKIYGQTIALLGIISDTGPTGGQAFSARPDSVIFWSIYNVVAGDSATFMILLYKGTDFIAQNFYLIAGNSNGLYQRFAFPINYASGITPDSLIIGFLPTNINGGTSAIGSYLVVDDISFSPSSPAVYNGDFETWFNYPSKHLIGWSFTEHVALDSTDLSGDQFVTQDYFNPPLDFAAELHNRRYRNRFMNADISTMPTAAPIMQFGPSFPVTTAHQSLNGYYKFFPVDHDTMSIHIELWKNGQRTSDGNFYFSDSVTEFAPFDIPLLYQAGSEFADSAAIDIRSSTGRANGLTTLFIDKLSFDGFTAGTQDERMPAYFDESGIKVYPNPTVGKLTVEMREPSETEGLIELIDLRGCVVTSTKIRSSQNKTVLEISGASSGLYLLRIVTGNKVFNRKVIVAR